LAVNGLLKQIKTGLAFHPAFEVDPRLQPQKAERRVLGSGKEDRNDRERGVLHLPIKRDVLLALLPRPEALRA